MDTLISDQAQVKISKKVQDLLCHLYIDDSQSKPYQQHQNPAEQYYKHVKHNSQ